MQYQVYAPSDALQPFIKCFWSLESEQDDKPVPQRVVPDGCMELIVHYGDQYRQVFTDGTWLLQPKSFVFGQITSILELIPTGTTGIIAARFKPEGMAPLLDVPIVQLENKATPLIDLFGDDGQQLENNVINSIDITQRLKLLESFLVKRLEHPATINKITSSCVAIILESQGQSGVQEMTDRMQINRKLLERKLVSGVGLTPKQLAKAIRLQSAIKMLQENNFSSLTALAIDNGYYDQAHFIRDFKEFTGTSPGQFFSEHLRFASLFASA